jgi:hypothetical protein
MNNVNIGQTNNNQTIDQKYNQVNNVHGVNMVHQIDNNINNMAGRKFILKIYLTYKNFLF